MMSNAAYNYSFFCQSAINLFTSHIKQYEIKSTKKFSLYVRNLKKVDKAVHNVK